MHLLYKTTSLCFSYDYTFLLSFIEKENKSRCGWIFITARNGNAEYLTWRIQSKALLHYFSHFFAKEPRKCWFFLFNPFMRNVEKWPNILLKSCTVSTSRFLKCVWPFYQHCVKSACILSFSGPHAGKCGSKKLRIRTLFTQCNVIPERINPIDNLIRTFQNF